MSNTTENALTKSYRGKFGDDFVMRTRDGLSIIAKPPRRRKRIATDIQEEIRDNFKNANKWSKDLVNKPDLLAEYTGRATGMMTAHVLAVTDFLKPPRVKSIVTADYRGNIGDVIKVKAKDDFKVASVAVKITAPNGDLLEEGPCVQDANYDFWSYTATINIPDLTDVTITATAKDNPEHTGWMELTL